MIDRFLTRIANARGFAGKLWVLVRPYWFAEERQTLALWGSSVIVKESWIARGLLAVIVALERHHRLHLQARQRLERALLQRAAGQERRRFWAELRYCAVLVALFIVARLPALVAQLLTIRWRRWLTEVYFRDWLADRTYYRMELTSHGTDNPEQRIEQDCDTFTAPDADHRARPALRRS